MKKTLIGLLVALLAVSSFGGLVATWSTYGFLDGAGKGYIFSEGVDTTKAVWDLVYTTKSSIKIEDIGFNSSTADGYVLPDGDQVLASRISTGRYATGATEEAAADWKVSEETIVSDEYGVPNSGLDFVDLTTSLNSGNLYAVIFQYTSAGVLYGQVTALQTEVKWANDGGLAGDNVCFDMGADTELKKIGTFTPGPTPPGPQPQVPEPATMSLLGLGALAMVLRRKLRK